MGNHIPCCHDTDDNQENRNHEDEWSVVILHAPTVPPKSLDVQMTETVKGKKHVRMTAPAILTCREMVKLRASGIVPWGIGITCCRC